MKTNQQYFRKVYKERFSGTVGQIPRADYPLFYLKTIISDNKDTMILDAGCGKGLYSKYLQEAGYRNVYPVDLFEEPILDLKNYTSSSIDKLPFKEEEFETIICNSVIYHLNDPRSALLELKRILKPGGMLYFTCHTKYSLFTLRRKLLILLGHKKSQNLKGIRFHSARVYRKWLLELDFELIRVDGYRVSFIIYPLYQRVAGILEKHLNIVLPMKKPAFSKLDWFARIKSEIAYHMVFIAGK